jgi:hypothetical protein
MNRRSLIRAATASVRRPWRSCLFQGRRRVKETSQSVPRFHILPGHLHRKRPPLQRLRSSRLVVSLWSAVPRQNSVRVVLKVPT